MKKYLSIIGVIITVLLISSCSKDPITFTKFPEPHWVADSSGKYPYSMTAVVQLSDTLKNFLLSTDHLGAFIDNECRGTGILIKTNTTYVYYVLIHGTASENKQITFKYYNSQNMYIYATTPFLPFSVDGVFGSPDNPKTLLLVPTN